MKKHLTSILILLLCLVPRLYVTAQGENVYANANEIPMPQVWSFMKYGKHTPNLYTGTVTESIPIYTYKDPDFEIPISLNYASNGYMPNIQASSVGLGWYLTAGGCITREIDGIKDDANNYIGGYGFYDNYNEVTTTVSSDYDLFKLTKANQYDNLLPYYYSTKPYYHTETTPDTHTFNFLGHYGRFSMGFNKQVYVYNTNRANGEYEIDLSQYKSTDDYWAPLDRSIITITTGDGYKYLFRNGAEAGRYLLYTRHGSSDYFDEKIPRNYWMLSQITAPNGRTVIFEYGAIEHNDKSQYNSKYSRESSGWITTTREYVAQLKSITVGDVVINFQYGERTSERVHHISFGERRSAMTPESLSSLKKLDKITVTHKQKRLKTCALSYSYAPENDNPVLFLRKVDISGEGVYEMDYYKMGSNYPKHATPQIDHWGYFNNPSNGNNIYDMDYIRPTVIVDETRNIETITSTNRNPNFEGAIRGMLKTLVYPTKGYAKFYYESHKYKRMVTRDLTDNHQNLPYLKNLTEEKIAGGVRIKRITNYTSDADSTYKEYYYCEPTSGCSGPSSGILLHFPWYSSTNGLILPANLMTYSMDKTHIEYSCVLERFSDSSYNKYNYSSYLDTPDIIYDKDHAKHWSSTSVGPASTEANFTAEMYSLAAQRGKLLKFQSYDVNGVLVDSKATYYQNSRTKKLKYHPSVKYAERSGYDYIHKVFVDDYDVASSIEDLIINGRATGYAKIKDYEYNSRGQVVKISYSKNFSGVIDRIDSIVYVNMDAPRTRVVSPLFFIQDYKMSALPMMKYTIANIAGKSYITDAYSYVYELTDSCLPYLSSVQRAIITQPLETATNLTYDYNYVTSYTCNNQGRVSSKTTDTFTTYYIWGYGGLHPIAEIKSESGTSISAISGLGNYRTLPLTDCLSDIQDVALRNIPGASVTTYKYIPFVGVSEIKDPSGRKTTYEYDSTGKLARVIDHDGNILEEYEYFTNNLENGQKTYEGLYYGTANCHICAGTQIIFDATPYRTSQSQNYVYTDNYAGKPYEAVRADMIWEDVVGLVRAVTFQNNTITVTTSGGRGNALIGLYDEHGNIVWSFHIWATEQPTLFNIKQSSVNPNNQYQLMDRDLGAIASDSHGLVYQFGRKDPFPSMIKDSWNPYKTFYVYDKIGTQLTVNKANRDEVDYKFDYVGTIAYAIANPFTFIMSISPYTCHWLYGDAKFQHLWGNPASNTTDYPNNESIVKTIYDPCPEGYKITPNDVYCDFTYDTSTQMYLYPGLDGVYKNSYCGRQTIGIVSTGYNPARLMSNTPGYFGSHFVGALLCTWGLSNEYPAASYAVRCIKER